MGTNAGQQDEGQSAGSTGYIKTLLSSGLTILGLLYVMGYIIVNGYQTEHLSYSAGAVQVKHVAAGLLYVVLTLFQIFAVASFLVSGFLDFKYPEKLPQKVQKSGMKEVMAYLSRFTVFGRPVFGVLRFAGIFAKNLAVAYIVVFGLFALIGTSYLPGERGWLLLLKSMRWWTAINFLISLVIAFGIYWTGSKRYERTIVEQINSEQAAPQPVLAEDQQTLEPASSQRATTSAEGSPESQSIIAVDQSNSRKRLFVESSGVWVAAPLLIVALTLLSLISFQGVYGHLKPNYGGGALYRVAVHLAPPSDQRPSTSDKPSATPNQPPAAKEQLDVPSEFRAKLGADNSWLLLVDKDASFLYVLIVDNKGSRNLIQIALSEVKALEVLPDPPIHPADAAYIMQQKENK